MGACSATQVKHMVKRYFPTTKFFPTRKGANLVKKLLEGKNPGQKFRVSPNAKKTAFRVERRRDI